MKKTHLNASVFGLLAVLVGAASPAQADCTPYAGITLGKNSLAGRWTSDEQLEERKLAFSKRSSYAVGALFGCVAHKGKFIYGGELDIGTGVGDSTTHFEDEGNDRETIKTHMSFTSHARLILGYEINGFTPYIGLGLAAARFNFTPDEPDNDDPSSEHLTTKNSVTVGTSLTGGISYAVNDKLSVRLEGGQDMFTNLCVPAHNDTYEITPKVNFIRIGMTYKI